MSTEDKIAEIEGELKLLKNEIKLGVTSIHDYILDLKASPIPPGDLVDEDEFKTNLGGGLDMGNQSIPPATPASNRSESGFSQEEFNKKTASFPGTPSPGLATGAIPQSPPVRPYSPASQFPVEDLDVGKNNKPGSQAFVPPQEKVYSPKVRVSDASSTPNQEMTSSWSPVKNNVTASTVLQGVSLDQEPRVNMLANLIGWVSTVCQKLGKEQLPIILEIYDMSGPLSPRIKKIILRLADIVNPSPGEESGTDILSQLILQLHGILMGSIPIDNMTSEKIEAQLEGLEKALQEDKQVSKNDSHLLKLKLVLPGDNGTSREIDLGEISMTDLKQNSQPI